MLERDSGEDSVHHRRAGGLALAREAAQDVPVPFAGLEYPATGWASQEDIAASASEVESGRSNTRALVAILMKAHSVSHAKRTRSGPESTASNQARLFSCCSAPG